MAQHWRSIKTPTLSQEKMSAIAKLGFSLPILFFFFASF
jgi:hypothetical protein